MSEAYLIVKEEKPLIVVERVKELPKWLRAIQLKSLVFRDNRLINGRMVPFEIWELEDGRRIEAYRYGKYFINLSWSTKTPQL